MKTYEWSNKHTAVRKCPKCGKNLEFADMKCPHCGADVRTERREYRPRLSSNEIQPSSRERIGAPHSPKEDYSFGKINTIVLFLLIFAFTASAAVGILVGNLVGSVSDKSAGIAAGILTAAICAVLLCCLVLALKIQLTNTAKAARNSERTALGVEYQIQQMNEFITAYNKDKEIEADNSEIFAKLLSKIGKLEESQKNSLEELTNLTAAMSRKLNRIPNAPVNIIVDESEETEFTDDFEEEEKVTEEAETEAKAEVEAKEEVTENTEETKEPEEDKIEEEIKEEIKEEIPEEPQEETEEKVEEAEKTEEKEEIEEAEESDDDDFYTIDCPRCGSSIKYSEDMIADGIIRLSCDVCGASIDVEIEDDEDDEEENEPSYDARGAYNDAFEEEYDKPKDRLEALFDDEDDD